RHQVGRLQSDKAQAKSQAEQHAKKFKEELTTSTQKKIGELQTALMAEEEKRGELENRLAEALRRSEALSRQVGSLEGRAAEAEGKSEPLSREIASPGEELGGGRRGGGSPLGQGGAGRGAG